MDENLKRLAGSLATQSVSRRLMNEFMEDVHRHAPPDLESSSLTEYVGDRLSDRDTLPPTLARQLGFTGVHERVLIWKSSDVTTPIRDLAHHLHKGIVNGAHCHVHVRPIHHEPKHHREKHENWIDIVYVPDEPGDHDLERVRQYDAHRVVHVCLPHSSPADVPPLDEVLWKHGLADDGRPRYSAYVRTLIVSKPPPRVIPFETIEMAHCMDDKGYRTRRDASVLSAADDDPNGLPEKPDPAEIDRWGRNVMFRQVAFATSGGGACAYRDIALLEALAHEQLPVDVYAGLSGGAFVGAYFVGDKKDGLNLALSKGEVFQKMLPKMMFSSVYVQRMIDEDLDYQQVGRTSVDFCPVATEMRVGVPPTRQLIRRATLGQAVRASGGAPVIFGPAVFGGQRYTDGMASAMVPTEVAIAHGGDVVMACNCIPGPNRSNPFGSSFLGRLAYQTPFGRWMDMFTWLYFMTQTASESFGHGCDVYFQFDPQNISAFEPLQWGEAYTILNRARQEEDKIDVAAKEMKQAWERLK